VSSGNTSSIDYGPSFYQRRREITLGAAKVVLGYLFARHRIASVVDFGCGTGTWLSVAKSLGATRVKGLEGTWVNTDMLDDPTIELCTRELEKEGSVPGEFDLAISLEVAEHLPRARAASFVAELAAASTLILFSAAIPGQTGVGHVNEQWQSYWARLFSQRGFQNFDVIRPLIWNKRELPVWYRQNMLLYAKDNAASLLRAYGSVTSLPLDLVHPELWLAFRRQAASKPS
jgi:SAM-dependent methyltransferase